MTIGFINEFDWKRIIYRMLYPGVLGSMIFDLLDPVRDFTLFLFPRLALALIFVIDYHHMTVGLDVEKNDNANPGLDLLIAILFCSSYFFLAHIDKAEQNSCFRCMMSLIFLTFAFLLIFLYEVRFVKFVKRVDMLRLMPTFICIPGVVLVGLSSTFNNVFLPFFFTLITICLSLVFYSIYVSKVDLKNRGRHKGQPLKYK